MSARALALTERLAPESASHAQALRRIGLQAFRKGELDRAATFFERSIDALESQTTRLGGSNEVRTAFAGQSHDYYVEYVDTLMAMDQPARAFEVLERSRARALLMMLAERDLVLDDDLSPELVQARRKLNEEYDQVQESLAGLNPGRDAAEVDRLQTRLRDLRESRARVIDKIRGASPRLAALQYPKPLNLAGMQQALDPGTALLSYNIGKDKSRLFVVEPANGDGPARLTVHTIPVGENALREQVAMIRRHIERQSRLSKWSRLSVPRARATVVRRSDCSGPERHRSSRPRPDLCLTGRYTASPSRRLSGATWSRPSGPGSISWSGNRCTRRYRRRFTRSSRK